MESSSGFDVPYVGDDFIAPIRMGGDSGLFRRTSAQEAIRREERARRHAGTREEESKSSRQRNRTSRGRPERMEQRLNEVINIAEGLGIQGGREFKNIAGVLRSLGETAEEQRGDIQDLSKLLDSNGDGFVDDNEIANARGDSKILSEVGKIHPVLARALRDPSFRVSSVEKKTVVPSHNSVKPVNQVDIVQQGYSNYTSDVNTYNL